MRRNNFPLEIRTKGLNFIELLVVGLLIEFIVIFFLFISKEAQETARDSVRKKEVSQIGKIITNPCFIPKEERVSREYDLSFLIKKIKKDKDYQGSLSKIIKDPNAENEGMSMYIYKISQDKKDCVLYCNLENSFLNETSLPFYEPIPGGGTGIFKAKTEGWNGSPFYFQYSN